VLKLRPPERWVLRLRPDRAAKDAFTLPPGAVVQGLQFVEYGKVCEYTIDIPAGAHLIYDPRGVLSALRINRRRPPWI